jgi:hypothetical protein
MEAEVVHFCKDVLVLALPFQLLVALLHCPQVAVN